MNVSDTLEALRSKALSDPALKQALLATRDHPNALSEFCRISTAAGLPIYDMDIIEYGESSYASMRRSTNGGGENSPLLDGEDDAYEMFLYELERQDRTPVPRALEFEGGSNFRDLGGYPASDGRHVKYGLIYRGGTLHDLKSEGDRAILDQLGLKLILDFRSAGERQLSPNYIPNQAKYCPQSAMRYENGEEVDFSPEGMKRWEKEYQKTDGISVIDYFKEYYARMPFQNPAYQAMFRALEQEEVPLLFHCTSGKDRTGVAAMLILLALGADRETAVNDYMETNRCRLDNLRELEQSQGHLKGSDPEKWDLLMLEFGVLQKLADAALDAVLARYGAWEVYFEKEFGLDQSRLDSLRDKYLC